jgi:hypothetical protein
LGEFQGAEEALAMAVVTNLLASSEPGGRKWVKGVPLTGVVVGVLGIRELVVFAFGWAEELGGRDVRAVAVVPLDAVVGMDSRDRERDHCSEEMRGLTGGSSGALGLDQNNVPQGVGSVGFSWGRENRQCEATIVQELREVGTDLLVGVQGPGCSQRPH